MWRWVWGERLKVGKEEENKGKEGEEARQEEWTLLMAFRSLCQMPMEGWAPALGPGEGKWGQPAWSASASSRRLWQRSRIPGPLGP